MNPNERKIANAPIDMKVEFRSNHRPHFPNPIFEVGEV
jgi:hypothetical protein